MTDKSRRLAALLPAVSAAVYLIPGVALTGRATSQAVSVFLLAAVLVAGTTLINVLPPARPPGVPLRPSRAELGVMAAVFACGVVQDALLWLLGAWLIGVLGLTLSVDGLQAAALAALLTRTATFGVRVALPAPAGTTAAAS